MSFCIHSPFQIRLMVLMLAVMSLAFGKAVKSRKNEAPTEKTNHNNRPAQFGTQENFPSNSLTVYVHIGHKEPASMMPHDIRNKSTSPWDYSINEDPNRFPHVISKATCRYNGCLNYKGQQIISMNSVPIQQEILVLRRKQMGSQQTYWLETQVVTVGCTCVIPTTNPMKSI
ncbi:interleukin-17F-like [Rhineura floridana]|uniref:interleukin-17F-like n=1 Tax=Rhineura floridana TaxID=261503 RepID=UPI002AC7ECBE|nr:interleukin-17F-like [Rhineura floridana]